MSDQSIYYSQSQGNYPPYTGSGSGASWQPLPAYTPPPDRPLSSPLPGYAGMYPPPVNYTHQQPAASDRGGSYAIVGLVLAIWSLPLAITSYYGILVPILAIVMASIGWRSDIRRRMATTGLILAFLGLLLNIIVTIYYFAS